MAERITEHFRLLAALAVAVLLISFIPLEASADTNLVIGQTAVIANANGDNVRLREEASASGALIGKYPEGTSVYVEDGPVESDDGSLWYQVSIGDSTGYMIADYLALESGEPVAVADGEDDGVAAPGDVIGTAWVAGSNGDGVRCRVSASTSAAVIMVVPEGDTLSLTGASDGSWQPVNCGGQAGYVSAQFVSYDEPQTDANAAVETEDAVVVGATTTGTAIVAADGDGLRCRTKPSTGGSVITVLADGASVDLRGDATDGWQPVLCANTGGYVAAQYLDYDGSSSADSGSKTVTAAAIGATTGTGTITNTGGDGIRCRSSASYSGSIITVLSEGTEISLRGNASGDWQPVVCASQNGYVMVDYVSTGTSSEDDTSASVAATTGTATVNSSGGLNCRSSASYSGSVITVLANGSKVDLRGSASGDWQPVYCADKSGYVFASYLKTGSSSGSTGNSGSSTSNSSFAVGSTVEVNGTNGTGVRLRSSASTSGGVLMVIAEGKTAKVRSGSTGDWVAVTYSGTNGFIHMDYLIAAGSSDSGSSSTNSGNSGTSGGTTTASLKNGDHAEVAADLRLRYDASTSAGIAAIAPEGTVVLITGRATNGFYPVDWDGLDGYMSGSYLTKTSAALSERGGSADNGNTNGGGSGTSGGSSTSGNAIVDYAMRYLGYPYVWATHGPSSFDCSGFTSWVIKNVLGMNIGYSVAPQTAYGTPVAYADLQPGDVVFFQNTYQFGLSHVGIYIGNGNFIHAENETTGVRISSLGSTYYSTRYWGARRMG